MKQEERNHLSLILNVKLANFMKERLLDADDGEFVRATDILLIKTCPQNVNVDSDSNITFGEDEIRILVQKFHLDERSALRAYRNYLWDKNC